MLCSGKLVDDDLSHSHTCWTCSIWCVKRCFSHALFPWWLMWFHKNALIFMTIVDPRQINLRDFWSVKPSVFDHPPPLHQATMLLMAISLPGSGSYWEPAWGNWRVPEKQEAAGSTSCLAEREGSTLTQTGVCEPLNNIPLCVSAGQ